MTARRGAVASNAAAMDATLTRQLDALARLALAGLFGGLVGIERGSRDT